LLLPLLVPQPLLRAMLLGGLLLLSLVLCVAPQQALPLLLLLLLLLLVWVGPLVESPPPSLCLKTS
jgi:hypothetical protein